MKIKVLFYCFIIILLSVTTSAQNSEDTGMVGKYVIKKVKPYGTEATDKECKNITKKELFDLKNIEDILRFPQDEFQVLGYKLTILSRGKDIMEYDSNTNQITMQMQEANKKIAIGDIMFFEYIKLRAKNKNSIRSVSPVCFIVVDK